MKMMGPARLTIPLTLTAVACMTGTAQGVPLESWDATIGGSGRFEVVIGGAGVLDRETQLVWEKAPNSENAGIQWADAVDHCYKKTVGAGGGFGGGGGFRAVARKGWRLPTIEELATLIDPFADTFGQPALPSGHPFSVFQTARPWSITTSPVNANSAYVVDLKSGNVFDNPKSESVVDPHLIAWCVRGGHGHDGGR